MLRTLDPAPFNAIAEHPSVKPMIGLPDPEGPVDFSKVVCNPLNVCLLTPDRSGGYMLVRLAVGLYAAHTLSVPGEGTAMRKLMREGFAYMFTATDCIDVVTHVPAGNAKANRWADVAGFREIMVRPNGFRLGDELVDLSVRVLSFMDWAMKEANNAVMGRHMHDVIRERTGETDHGEDAIHDAMVGAAMVCAEAGQVEKGVLLYNRWAMMAGYERAHLVSVNPPLLDFGKGMIHLAHGRFDVLAKPSPAAPHTSGEKTCRPAQVSPPSGLQ